MMRLAAIIALGAALIAPSVAGADTYAVVQVASSTPNVCTDGVDFPSRIGNIVAVEGIPTYSAALPWWQEPNGVWNAVSEIYGGSTFDDPTGTYFSLGAVADLSCSGDLSQDQYTTDEFSTLAVGDYFDVPVRPDSYLVSASAVRDGFVDGGTTVTPLVSHIVTGPAAIRFHSARAHVYHLRVLKNGVVVKRGPSPLAPLSVWKWTPRTHGTYVVRWTSHGVLHSRTVTR